MKKYLLLMSAILLAIGSHAQYTTGTPPAVEWSKTDIWPTEPVYYTPPLASVPAEKSGEDWFFNVAVRYNTTTKQPIGYVSGGYMSDPALHNFHVSDLNALGGCGTEFINLGCDDLRLTDLSGLSGYDMIVPGVFMPGITVMDLNGNHAPSDYKRFETHGEFKGVIPTSDGGYLGFGYTFYSSRLNFSGGSIIGISPIYYNPTIGQPLVSFETASNGGNMINFPGLNGKALVVKYNSNLSADWYYTYGNTAYAVGPSNPAFAEGTGLSHAMECSGGYIIGGGSSVVGGWYKKIDANGNILWSKQMFTPAILSSNIESMQRTIENGSEVFYMAGSYDGESVYVSKLDASGTVLWTSIKNPSPSPGALDNVSSIGLSTDGNLYLGGASSLSGPGGYGYIYKINSSNGATLYSYVEPFLCYAQDLKYSIAATSNGGCAAVSTVIRDPVGCTFQVPQNYVGYTGAMCNPGFSIWNSDAYVTKFDNTLTKIWSTAFDASTDTPGGTALDILSGCSTCGGSCPLTSWEIPNQLGLDVTRRECMFGITEGPDRGLVVVGKNARNLDDCYIVKLECEAEYSPLVIASTTITGTQKYKAGAIETNTNFIAANTSRITMDACKYILFDAVTTLTSGSVVTASVASYNCCNSGGTGTMRVGLSDAIIPNSNESMASSETLGNMKVNIFPNPNSGIFSVSLEASEKQSVYIEVLEPMGKNVLAPKEVLVSGQLSTEINLSTYKKGIYVVKIYSNSGGKNFYKKVVVE